MIEEYTVKIHHEGHCYEPTWTMEINMKELINPISGYCAAMEYSKEETKKAVADQDKKIKKILKLIFQECSESEIEQVQQYLNRYSKKFAKEFEKIRSKGR